MDDLKRKLKNFFKKRTFPAFSQWKQIFKVLNRQEKVNLSILSLLFISSGLFLILNTYFQNTEIQAIEGGEYKEGVLGRPQFINPIFAPASDVDRDLTELLFLGLFTYDGKGEIIPDLVKEYQVKDGGKVYEISLKENIFWSDGKPFSGEDVLFTVKIIQDPEYHSPLRSSFLGVEVEKISDSKILFKLKSPYPPFLETLTLKILPKHVWEGIPPESFPLATYNLQPIGTGPFQFKNLIQTKSGTIQSLNLTRNPYYSAKKPFLREITFYFFNQEEDLLRALKKKEIDGMALSSPFFLEHINQKNIALYKFFFPRYFDLSFNLKKSEILTDRKVRKALLKGTDREEIIEEVLSGEGEIVYSPFLFENSVQKTSGLNLEEAKEILEKAGWQEQENGPRIKKIKKEAEFLFKSDLKLKSQGAEVRKLQECLAKDKIIYPEGEITGYFGEKTKLAVIRFQEKHAADILEPEGFQKGTGMVGKTTRAKLNEICFPATGESAVLKLSLITVDQQEIIQVAEILKKQWEKIGVELEIKKIPLPALEKDYIKPRNYEILLFGKVIGLIPDPYPFWHSSQIRDPGLNLSLYENKEVDKILEDARQILDEEERKEKYERFQEILLEDTPTLFLYSPHYLYLVSKKIRGIEEKVIADPSKRFLDIDEWYIKTKRVWK